MYYGAEVGSLDGSTDGTVDRKFDGLLLGARLGSDVDLELWGSLSFFGTLGISYSIPDILQLIEVAP